MALAAMDIDTMLPSNATNAMSLVALSMMHHSFGRHGIGPSYSTARHGIGRHWLLVLGIHPLPPHPCRHFHAVPFGGMPLGSNVCHLNAMDG